MIKKDFFGNVLAVGDEVAYFESGHRNLKLGKISKLNAIKATIDGKTCRDYNAIIKKASVKVKSGARRSSEFVADHWDDGENEYIKYYTAYLDGYSIAERKLEGLIFEYSLDNQGFLTVNLWDNKFNKFPEGMDEGYWLDQALEFGINNDCFDDSPDNSGEYDLCFNNYKYDNSSLPLQTDCFG